MSFFCQRPLNPGVGSVDRVYNASNEEGHIYLRNGTLPPCSSTDPPPPYSCVVCLEQKVYALCSNLLNKGQLVMEGDGQEIELITSDCPGLSARNENADISADGEGERQRLFLLLPLLLLSLLLLVIFLRVCLSEMETKVSERKTPVRRKETDILLQAC